VKYTVSWRKLFSFFRCPICVNLRLKKPSRGKGDDESANKFRGLPGLCWKTFHFAYFILYGRRKGLLVVYSNLQTGIFNHSFIVDGRSTVNYFCHM